MLRQFARVSLRRSLHTSARDAAAGTRAHRARVALGASAVAGTYLAWSLSTQRVALDAKPDVQAGDAAAHPLSTTTATSRKAVESTVTAHTHTPSSSSSPKTSAPAPEATDVSAPAAADPSDTTAVEGEGSEAASGAYDPVTGEINWDCPCLGGMAHGPCGPQFREAFSCFIYSEQEPKGIDCVEKFKGMQDCFREHPEVYAEEIMDDDEEEDGVPAESTLIKEETTLSAESSPSDLASSSPAPASA